MNCNTTHYRANSSSVPGDPTHDAPWLLRRGQVQRIRVDQIGGPPLCACEGFPYDRGKTCLVPGDMLVLTTDGVTEASDGQRWFGQERLEALFAAQDQKNSPTALTEQIRSAVRSFEAGAPPSDDLTLLVLQWLGPQGPSQPPPPINER